MNRAALVQVDGKREKGTDGRVVVQKKDGEEATDFLKKTIQIFSGQAKATYEVIGKCNTVQLMDSKDCTLEVDTVVSGVEITNCKNVTVRVKGTEEFWTCTANKASGCVIELNETVFKGGKEFLDGSGVKKAFNLIGAAVSDIKVRQDGKDLPIQDYFQFTLDMSVPKLNHAETKAFTEITEGVGMAADGEGFSVDEGTAKGKAVLVEGKQGKKSDMVLNVKGATNSVVLKGCKRVLLTVGKVQKEIQVIDCKRVKVVVRAGGGVPKISVKNSHGCYVTLEEPNENFTMVANQYSDLNMNFPFGAESEKKELSLQEQWVYKFDSGKAVFELPTF